MACLAILFCVDLSVYAVLTNKRTTQVDPEAIDAVVEAKQFTAVPASVLAVPAPAESANTTTNDDEHDPFAWHGPLWEHTYGDYTVKTIRGPDFETDSILQIFKAGTLVYSNSSHSFNDPGPSATETNADDSSLNPLRPGTNITGNGIPNLVISDYSGGAHCCLTYHIYELGDEFHEVDTINVEHGDADFTDLDNDGIPEVQVQDWEYAYVFTGFGDSPAPAVVLRYVDGKYQVATELMFTEAPTDEEFNDMVNEIKAIYAKVPSGSDEPMAPNEWGSEPILWKEMLDLTYKGHVDLALKLFDTCWDAGWTNKGAAAIKFWAQVAESQYGRAVVEDQGYELPQPAPEPDPTMDINENDTGRAYHIVDIGDSLASIAKQHGVTVEALMKANNITDSRRVYISQKLLIP